VNFYYPFIDPVSQHLKDRFSEEIKGVLLASFIIPAKLHMLNDTVAAKIERTHTNSAKNTEFAHEVGKLTPSEFMSLSEQFQNSDSFIHIKGIYFFLAVTRWKMKNNNSDAQQIQSLQQAVSHCDEEFYPNISSILQLLLTPPVGSCPCERSFSSLRRLKTWSRKSKANSRLPRACFSVHS